MEQEIKKNPWWVKAMPHVFIIVTLIQGGLQKHINFIDGLMVFLFIYVGPEINKNKFIVSPILKIAFIVLAMGSMYDLGRFLYAVATFPGK